MQFLPETPVLRGDGHRIINRALRDALPDRSEKQALSRLSLPERVTLVAVGKAAWRGWSTAAAFPWVMTVPTPTALPTLPGGYVDGEMLSRLRDRASAWTRLWRTTTPATPFRFWTG